MEHYSQKVLIDFVRGVPSFGRSSRKQEHALAGLQSHFASGCQSCTATLHFWKQVANLAAVENSYGPPENVVRMAKLEFAAMQSRRPPEAVEARIVFDTWQQPALAGVRSVAAAVARQIVYEADGYIVDLRLDRRPHSHTAHLIGQVLDSTSTEKSLGALPVTLCTDRDALLAESKTNSLGEFHLEFTAQHDLQLSIWTHGKPIRIVLTRPCLQMEWDGNKSRTDAGNQ